MNRNGANSPEKVILCVRSSTVGYYIKILADVTLFTFSSPMSAVAERAGVGLGFHMDSVTAVTCGLFFYSRELIGVEMLEYVRYILSFPDMKISLGDCENWENPNFIWP